MLDVEEKPYPPNVLAAQNDTAQGEATPPQSTISAPISTPKQGKRATIRDVAAAAGVSRGTVTRVLNGHQYVSEASRDAVLKACEETGYVPNRTAQNLARRQTGTIGFVIQEPYPLMLTDPNIGQIMLGANQQLSEDDHQMAIFVVDSERDSERLAGYLSGGYVDGVISVSSRENDPLLEALTAAQVPTITVGRAPAKYPLPWVGIDNSAAAESLTKQLMDTGRQNIAIVAAALDRESGADRLQGFRAALGSKFQPQLVASVEHYDFHQGKNDFAELLEKQPEIDGVFATSDALAAGVIEAIRESGRTVPHDIGVVGFDDSDWATRTVPPLTTVYQPTLSLGQAAAEALLNVIRHEGKIQGGQFPEGAQIINETAVLLPTKIVWRESA